MIRRSSRALFVSAGALLVAFGGTAGASTTPKSLVLQKTEVPSGYKFLRGQIIPNTYVREQRGLTAKEMASYGRVTGYTNQWVRRARAGIYGLSSEVVLFKNADGAHRYYLMLVTTYEKALKTIKTSQHLSANGIGDEDIALAYSARSSTSDKIGSQYGMLVLRRGNYLAHIQMVGPNRTWKPTEVVPLARTVDKHLQSAH